MITPNKYIDFENSIIFKMLSLIKDTEQKISVVDLYKKHEADFDGIDEFIFSLDALYALDRIEIDFNTGIINYVS